MTTGEMRYLWLVDLSAKRALRGQTPSNLRAYSFAVDAGHRSILLRAHFATSPSEADIDDI